MIAFMWQVLSVTTGVLMPVIIALGLLCSCIPRPLAQRVLAGAGASIFLLSYEYILSFGSSAGWRIRRPPRFDFWEALPAWAVAGALMTLLWFLIVRGLVWAFNNLPEPPDPPKPPNSSGPPKPSG